MPVISGPGERRCVEYVLTLLVVAAVTYLLTPLVRQAAIRFRAVIPARARDVHADPIPRMGGVAMYIGVAAGLLVGSRPRPAPQRRSSGTGPGHRPALAAAG